MKLPFASWFKQPATDEHRLLRRCSGDRAQMERLIAFEIARMPSLSREKASSWALERWNRR